MLTKKEIWETITRQLRSDLSSNEFETWVSPAVLQRCDRDSMEIRVANKFVARWLEERYARVFRKAVLQTLNLQPDIRFVHPDRGIDLPPAAAAPRALETHLDPSCTFATFISADHNRFAYASALNAAEHPGDPYNPLYIYSPPGLGKTHLLNAVGNHAAAAAGPAAVAYLSAYSFYSRFSAARKNRTAQPFSDLDRRLHYLLFDDTHELGAKRHTQIAFLSLLNRFMETNRQVVLAGRVPPGRIPDILPELQSRLESGILAEVKVPAQDVKIRIIRQKAEQEGLVLPEDAAFFLANNTRDFKAAHQYLVSLQAHISLTGKSIDLSTVKQLVKERLPRRVGSQAIQRITAEYFNISVADLLSNKKSRRYAYPRQVAMALTRRMTSLSLKQIGEAFGKRDHSTVIYALRRIEEEDRNAASKVHQDLMRIQSLVV